MTGTLERTIDAFIGTITIANEPRRNAMTLKMWRSLPGEVAALLEAGARVIVIRGAGDTAFSAGADISEFETVRRDAASGAAYEAANADAFAALRKAPCPTIAAVAGFCFGGGFGLAAACDLRVASTDALFAIPAAKLGVAYPPEALADVVRLIGASAAKDLFYTARRIGAEEAERLGFVNRLVDPGMAVKTALDLAQLIAANAPLTQRAAKLGIDAASGDRTVTEDDVARAADACFDSADFAEGRSAFLERRQPNFRGE